MLKCISLPLQKLENKYLIAINHLNQIENEKPSASQLCDEDEAINNVVNIEKSMNKNV